MKLYNYPYFLFLYIYRTMKDNYRISTSKNSDNTDCIIVMRRGQVQERSDKQSSLHDSTTWNCRSGNGNRSSEKRKNSVKLDFPLFYLSYFNYYVYNNYTIYSLVNS